MLSTFLIKLLVQPDVEHYTEDDSAEWAELYSVDIVPTHYVAEYQYQRSDNDEDKTQVFQKSIHNLYCFLVLLQYIVQN